MFGPKTSFFSSLQGAVEWREPEGQGVQTPFTAYSFVVYKRVRRQAGTQPRDFEAVNLKKATSFSADRLLLNLPVL